MKNYQGRGHTQPFQWRTHGGCSCYGILQGALGGVLGIISCCFSSFGVRRWWVVWSFLFELAWLPAGTRFLCHLEEGRG